MKKRRILIADDQRLFASSLKVVLEEIGAGEIEVVGVAHDGIEAIEMASSLVPDLILMDIRMPNMDGVEATKQIRHDHPNIKVMMLTTFDDDAYVNQALSGGATGYILKNIEPEELLASVRAVCSGTFLVSSAVGYRLFSGGGEVDRDSDDIAEINFLMVRFPSLRKREAEVLHLMMQGLDNNQIADRLFIAEQTVRNYASVIYTKIGVQNRLHALQLIKNSIAEK